MINGRAMLLAMGQPVPGVLDTSPCESKLWPHSAAKETEKNVLAISIGAYHLAIFDSTSYWSSSMFNMAVLNGCMASFMP